MANIVSFQDKVLKDKWQSKVVYKVIKDVLRKYTWIKVYKNYMDFKNDLYMRFPGETNDVDWGAIFNDTTRIIELNKDQLGKKGIVIFTDPYMVLFENEILRLKQNRNNIKRVIKSTYDLLNTVIYRELGIIKPKVRKESIWDKIKKIFKIH